MCFFKSDGNNSESAWKILPDASKKYLIREMELAKVRGSKRNAERAVEQKTGVQDWRDSLLRKASSLSGKAFDNSLGCVAQFICIDKQKDAKDKAFRQSNSFAYEHHKAQKWWQLESRFVDSNDQQKKL